MSLRSAGHGTDARSSVPAAIAVAALAGATFERAVRSALAIDGDTDTIASMAGAIVGARLGADAIPLAWLDRLADRDHLPGLVDALVAPTGAPDVA